MPAREHNTRVGGGANAAIIIRGGDRNTVPTRLTGKLSKESMHVLTGTFLRADPFVIAERRDPLPLAKLVGFDGAVDWLELANLATVCTGHSTECGVIASVYLWGQGVGEEVQQLGPTSWY